MTIKNFDTLREANVERDKLWDPHAKLGPLFHAVELAGEVGEALNIVKKLDRERLGIDGARSTEELLAEELADVAICTDKLAMKYGIDLEGAIVDKFNETSRRQNFPVRITSDLAVRDRVEAKLALARREGKEIVLVFTPASGRPVVVTVSATVAASLVSYVAGSLARDDA